jgi:hypothetical protein
VTFAAHTCLVDVFPCAACEEGRHPEAVAIRCRQLFDRLIGPVRAVAKHLGYAVAVHGSLARDIDLIAVAWSEKAVSPMAVSAAIIDEIQRQVGPASIPKTVKHYVTGELIDQPESKPHGRIGWAIHFHGGAYVDLSVVGPRIEVPTT